MNGNMKAKMRPAALVLLLIGLLALLIAPIAQADAVTPAATQRPIEEFIAAQGTYCFDDGAGGCLLFVPPLQNFLGQSDPARNRVAAVDYAGITNQYLLDNGHDGVGTTMSGKVIEKPRPDGRATVEVTLNTKKAIVWVVDGSDFVADPLLFGYRVDGIMAGGQPGLCTSKFNITFINTAPGAPLPDLIQLAIFPEPGQEITKISSSCDANGPLREAFGVEDGTPGKASSTQVAKVKNGALTFTTEKITVKAR